MEIGVYQKIRQAIDQAQRPMIVSHRRPDGDTLGAALALYLVLTPPNPPLNKGGMVANSPLNKEGKVASFLFCQDKIERQFDFIKEISKYSHSKEEALQHNPDFIFCLDCGDLKQAGFEDIRERIPKAKIINIDHHISNSMYGDVNLIDPAASSTCEVLYNLFKKIDIPINSRIATMLFLGIFTDTNNFSNSATTPQALFAASELWRCGIFITEIKNNILKNKTISFLKLWGLALRRIKFNSDLNIASTYVNHNDLISLGLDSDSTEGLSNFLNANLNVETIAVLKELDNGIVKGSLRTTSDEIDLTKLARVFGGGGHKKASGFSVEGKIKVIGDSWLFLLKSDSNKGCT